MTTVLRWLFTDRRTGAIVIGQWPNVPLWIFLAASLVGWMFHPTGLFAQIVALIGAVALTIWAMDEILRGVCPWRRLLGGAVLTIEMIGWVRSAAS